MWVTLCWSQVVVNRHRTFLGYVRVTLWNIFICKKGSFVPACLSVSGMVMVTLGWPSLLPWVYHPHQIGQWFGGSWRQTWQMWGMVVQRWSRGGVWENDSVFSKNWPTKTLRHFVKGFQISNLIIISMHLCGHTTSQPNEPITLYNAVRGAGLDTWASGIPGTLDHTTAL